MLKLPDTEFKTERGILLDLIQHNLETYKSFGEQRKIFKVTYQESDDFDFERFPGQQFAIESTNIPKD